MKIFLLLFFLALWGCGEEKVKSNQCEVFLRDHPEIANRYERLECLDSATIFYELSFLKGYVFFAKFNRDSMWTTRVGLYFRPDFPVMDLEKWDMMSSRWTSGKKYSLFEKEKIRADTMFQRFSRSRKKSFEEFKAFIKDVDRISDAEFDRQFDDYDSLASFYTVLGAMSLWNLESAIAKKNDSSFYILGPSLSQGYLLEASSNGGKGRKIFQFDIYNCCGAGRYKAPKEIEASDSSFLVKLQGENWIYYHEPKDSLAFFIKDSLDFYLITHFRKNVGPIDYLMPRKEAPCPLEYNCVS